MTGEWRVGCSGYEYEGWRGELYPKGLPKSRWLETYASVFDTVEINGTFYRLPEATTFDAWRERVPDGFVFALKLSQYGTHRKHLKDPESWLPVFRERAERLGPKLGPVLAQLPPHWGADAPRLDPGLLEFDKHGGIHGVAGARPVEDQPADGTAALDLERLVGTHSWMLRRFTRIPTVVEPYVTWTTVVPTAT